MAHTIDELEVWGTRELIEEIIKLQNKQTMTRRDLEDEILDLVDDSQELTYSDIQGVAMAIATKAIKE